MEAWSGIDKLKEQLQQNKSDNIETPKTIEEAKSFCDIFADEVKEAQRQNALENEYTKTIRLLYLKVGELDNIIKLLDEKKTQKRVAEYEQVYNELLEITEKQNRLYAEISKYRTITPEQQEKGFL